MERLFEDYARNVAQLCEAAIAAADPYAAVRRRIRREDHQLFIGSFSYDLDQGSVFVVSVGKAAIPMGLAAAEVVAEALTSAVLVTKKTSRDWQSELANTILSDRPSTVALLQGGHPIPDADSVAAAHVIYRTLSDTRAGDLVLFLISGGASAILADPLIPLDEWRQLNEALLAAGCTISEINCVRRQLDRVKGGGLARQAAPATCYSLILSDVVGNPLSSIGSGPTVYGQDTPAEAIAVLNRYGLSTKLGTESWARTVDALNSKPHDADRITQASYQEIVGDVRQAAQGALIRAAQMGFLSQILTTRLQGEASEVAHVIAAIAHDLPPDRCLILGGETTVTLSGQGEGGRNLEMALATAIDIAGTTGIAVACFATDGEDGTTGAAGALVTGNTIPLARAAGLSAAGFLERNDSYGFFRQLEELDEQTSESRQEQASRSVRVNHLIETGPTGTNVNDLVFILTGGSSTNWEGGQVSPNGSS